MVTLDDLYDVWTIDHRIEYTDTHNPDTCPTCQRIIAVGKKLYAQGANEEDDETEDIDKVIELCSNELAINEIANRTSLSERFIVNTLNECGMPYYRYRTNYKAISDTSTIKAITLGELSGKLHVSVFHLRELMNTKRKVKGFSLTSTSQKIKYVDNVPENNNSGDKGIDEDRNNSL